MGLFRAVSAQGCGEYARAWGGGAEALFSPGAVGEPRLVIAVGGWLMGCHSFGRVTKVS